MALLVHGVAPGLGVTRLHWLCPAKLVIRPRTMAIVLLGTPMPKIQARQMEKILAPVLYWWAQHGTPLQELAHRHLVIPPRCLLDLANFRVSRPGSSPLELVTEVGYGEVQPCIQWYLWVPMERAARQGNIGAAPGRIILGQLSIDDA